jgi:hypothetical protein
LFEPLDIALGGVSPEADTKKNYHDTEKKVRMGVAELVKLRTIICPRQDR